MFFKQLLQPNSEIATELYTDEALILFMFVKLNACPDRSVHVLLDSVLAMERTK